MKELSKSSNTTAIIAVKNGDKIKPKPRYMFLEIKEMIIAKM